jgi:hypothetical protein
MRPVAAALIYADRRTDKWMDTTKVISTFGGHAKAPKKRDKRKLANKNYSS